MYRRHLPFRLSKAGAVLETLKSLYESSCNGMTLRGIKTVDEPNIYFEIAVYEYKVPSPFPPLLRRKVENSQTLSNSPKLHIILLNSYGKPCAINNSSYPPGVCGNVFSY